MQTVPEAGGHADRRGGVLLVGGEKGAPAAEGGGGSGCSFVV